MNSPRQPSLSDVVEIRCDRRSIATIAIYFNGQKIPYQSKGTLLRIAIELLASALIEADPSLLIKTYEEAEEIMQKNNLRNQRSRERKAQKALIDTLAKHKMPKDQSTGIDHESDDPQLDEVLSELGY